MKENPSLTPSASQEFDEHQATETRDRASEVLNNPRLLEWQPQEPPFDHPDSCCRFELHGKKHVVSTRAALETFGQPTILAALEKLCSEAQKHDGLDYLQVFHGPNGERLWVIEDDVAITALLPEDY